MAGSLTRHCQQINDRALLSIIRRGTPSNGRSTTKDNVTPVNHRRCPVLLFNWKPDFGGLARPAQTNLEHAPAPPFEPLGQKKEIQGAKGGVACKRKDELQPTKVPMPWPVLQHS
jgi:hypothetical protein